MSKDYEGVVAVIDTTAGELKLEFFADKAPGHVKNFLDLARKGYYDGSVFHRVVKGFVIQGGCPEGTGRGGPGYTIKAEFSDRIHELGILSMARKKDPDSAGSQFFICLGRVPHLDKSYTVFGQVTSGIEVVQKIGVAPTGAGDRPIDPVAMDKVVVIE